MSQDSHKQQAEKIRNACINIAKEAYEDAGIRGLCHEGRWELALDAMKHLDLQKIIADESASK